MRQLVTSRTGSLALVLGLLVWLLAGTESAGGDVIAESKDFRLITSVPLGGVAVGGQVVGDTYFVSSWQTGLYSYDVSDPKNPVQLDHLPEEIQANENEDLATNGEILLLSQFNRIDALNRLRVIDVSDPSNMKVIATLPGAGGHTLECLYDCKWAYGSSNKQANNGIIIDLRNPKKPKLLDQLWSDVMGDSAHDVTEVRPGLVVTSSSPMFVLDTTNPAKPRILMKTPDAAEHITHNNIWPRGGKDRFMLSASEGVNNGRCELYGEDGKTLQVWDTSGWRTGSFNPAGTYTLTNGEGHPPVDALGVQGCSAHWAHEHPSFNNGGLVAMAAYSHGVRLLHVTGDGKIREVGYFLKDVHGAIDVEWVTDRIVYVIEDGGGIGAFDVIEYTGKLVGSRQAVPAAGVGTIKTGIRTGPVRHHDTTIGQVKRWFGAPDDTSTSSGPCGEMSMATWNRKMLVVGYNTGDKTVLAMGVGRARTRSKTHGAFTWKTDKGLRIGDSRARMKRLYPDAQKQGESGGVEFWRVQVTSDGALMAVVKSGNVFALANQSSCS